MNKVLEEELEKTARILEAETQKLLDILSKEAANIRKSKRMVRPRVHS